MLINESQRGSRARPTDSRPGYAVGLLRCALLLVIFGLAFSAVETKAHDSLAAYVQHRVVITVGARHTDVTVQLTFFEEQSEHEREHIDANSDGRLSRSEVAVYMKHFEADTTKAITLRMGGQIIPITPLRAPEIDLLGQQLVGRGHLRLTLYFFAVTPTELVAGDEVAVEDWLWPTVRALASIQAAGKDGCRMEALPAADPLHPPAKSNEARTFKAAVVSPPTLPKKELSHTPTRQP